MHPQPSSTQSPPSAAPSGDPFTSQESRLLCLLIEHVSIPDDQLARLLAIDEPALHSLLTSLDEKGCIRSRRFLAGDRPWYWPSRRGLRLAVTDCRYKEPNVRHLTHRRAIVAARLHLATIAPQGQWVTERMVHRMATRGTHVPDGVLVIGDERHAIEVELTRKPEYKVRAVLDEHSARYNAVVYFCGPRTKPLLVRLREAGLWPNLRVLDLPKEA
jgi:hypothetical protein